MRKHTISFRNAARGIVTATSTQINMRIHIVAATIVFILGVTLKVSMVEALVLILTVSSVMVAEMINTAIEFACDAVTEQENEYIGYAKDISAGGVLLAAIFATIVGLFIFVPKLL